MASREERAVTIPQADGGGAALDALYVAPDSAREDPGGAVIAPPHPLYGGSMDSPVVNELSYAFAKTGLATLRFDWRGVGASAGRASGELADAREDYAGALLQLGASVSGSLIAAGYSFGAAAAALAAVGEPRVRALVLVAPPPSLLDARALTARPLDVLVVTGEHDAIAPAAPLRALVEKLPRGRFAQIEEAGHFYGAGLAELGKAVTSWLADGS